jgi:hypothetical protein
MLACRGGLAVQRRYRLEGRHPTACATECRVSQQAARASPGSGGRGQGT